MTPLDLALHLASALVLPPLLLGVVNRVKALLAGRVGPPLLQGWFDIVKLLRKGALYSRTTTWVFRAGPVVSLAAALVAAALVPMGGDRAPLAFPGDLLLLAYLLGLGRFFTVLAALDTGSAFEGMGASREASWASLAEPAMLVALLVPARATGSLSLSGMLGAALPVAPITESGGASVALVLVGLFIVLLAECSRIPVDDPNTHLELTMVHEVMVLDHGGPAFGLVQYGAALKAYLLAALVVRVALPWPAAGSWAGWPLFLTGVLAVGVAVGVVESVMARLRLAQVPTLLAAALLLSTFGLALQGVG